MPPGRDMRVFVRGRDATTGAIGSIYPGPSMSGVTGLVTANNKLVQVKMVGSGSTTTFGDLNMYSGLYSTQDSAGVKVRNDKVFITYESASGGGDFENSSNAIKFGRKSKVYKWTADRSTSTSWD